jgi:hypothetical protein
VNKLDSTASSPPAYVQELVDRQLVTHQRQLRELLSEVLAAADGSLDVALQALDAACAERTTPESFYWTLAALAFEDRAVQLAETWLDDQDLPPARRERVIELLTSVPGYWPLHGLDGDQAEQVIGRLGIATSPRPIAATLGFVLGVLDLVDEPQERERILVG